MYKWKENNPFFKANKAVMEINYYWTPKKKTFSQKNKNKIKQPTLFAAKKKVFLGENHHLNSLLFCPLPAVQGDSENSDWLSEDQKPRGIMLHPCTGINTTGSDLGVRNVFVRAPVWVKTRRGLQRGVRATFEEKKLLSKTSLGRIREGGGRQDRDTDGAD